MILLTGATGTVGRALARELAESGAAVRALVRDPSRAADLAAAGVALERGDLADPQSLRPAFDGVEALFLLAPASPVQVELETNAVEAARAAGVRRIVKLSVIDADEGSPARILRQHRLVERRIEEAGFAWTHLRPHYFMQNTLAFAPTVAAEGAFYVPAGPARIPLVDARDVAAVAARCLLDEGPGAAAIPVTGGEALGFDDVAARIAAAIGKPVRAVDVPPEAAREGMLGAGLPEWLADALLELFALWREAGAQPTSRAVEEITGRPPRTYEAFAREHAAVFAGGP